MNIMRWRILFIGLTAWAGVAGMVSCVSTDDAPAGGRVEYPDPGAKTPPPPAPAQATSEPSVRSPSPSDVDEPPSRFTLSPIDKVIKQDYPARRWSKNVPERSCTKDDECGDGFCDRGRCAAIWTGSLSLGQRCESDGSCGSYLCIDGRCRSCASDEECKRTESWQDDPKCESDYDIPNGRECSGIVGSGHRGIIVPPVKDPGNNVVSPKSPR
jgi:hypothetical protein